MQRAAAAKSVLLPLATLQELLEIATAAETPDVIERVARILNSEEVFSDLKEDIRKNFGNIGVTYSGDLADGEAHDVDIGDDIEIEDFSVIASNSEAISVVVKFKVPLTVHVQYEDRDSATYDKEEGVYIGAETAETEFEDDAHVRLFVSINPSEETIDDIEFLTQDIYVAEPYEAYK